MAKAWKKIAQARMEREAGMVAPAPKTDGDPEFDALPVGVKTEIHNALEWMLEMERSPSPHQTAEAIAERYDDTDTGGRKNTGLSAGSIYRRFLAWRKAGRGWRPLEKYKTLRKGESVPLQAYNLDHAAAHAFFARQSATMGQWAEMRGFNADTVSAALTGHRRTRKSQQILDALVEDMRCEPDGWHRIIHALQAEAVELRARTDDFERRLADWKKRLSL